MVRVHITSPDEEGKPFSDDVILTMLLAGKDKAAFTLSCGASHRR
jgi:hypothetical protein